MMRTDGSVRPRPRPERDESGSSVVEMLVAAGLTVTALGVLLGNVVVPLEHLARAHAPDMASIELRTAGEEVARLVRAARPGIVEPAVVADGEGAVVVRVFDGGRAEHVRIALVGDALEVERRDADGVLVVGSRRTLVSGLVPHAGRLVAHDDPAGGAMGLAGVLAVELQLVGTSASLERTVAVRLSSHLDGAGGW
jgi:hypothetical protein